MSVRFLWRIVYTLVLLALLLLLSILSGYTTDAASHSQGGSSPLVLAFYYSWYDENTWRPETVPDFPLEPYVSRDRGAMGHHIDQARQAGIDALMLAWYGPSGQSNQTEPNLAAMLDEAAARDFKIGILFETTSPFFAGPGDATAALRHAIQVHSAHASYLRVDGKPVLFFWRPQLWSVDTWREIRNQVDPGHNTLWIAEGVDLSYQAVFDGHHLYSNTWNPPTDLNYTNQKFARQVADARQAHGAYKYWVATVMPGYDDTRTGRANAFARDREGGAYYERSWQAAIASNPDWIVITSFNEWPEGTYIEPSTAYGHHFLDLTAKWSHQFKAGRPAEEQPAARMAEAEEPVPVVIPATATPRPEPSTPTAYVTATVLNLRSGPTTEHEVVAQLPQDTALAITGKVEDSGTIWWQVSYGGNPGWIHGDFVVLAGPMATVPIVSAPPPPPAPAAGQEPAEEAAVEAQQSSSTRVYELLLGDVGRLLQQSDRNQTIDEMTGLSRMNDD